MTSRITSKTKGANKAVIKKSSSRRSSISNREENGSVIEEKEKKKNAPVKSTIQKNSVKKSELKSTRSKNPPTSNRVTKSQYFPSKNIYSDALLAKSDQNSLKKSTIDSKLVKSSIKSLKSGQDSKIASGSVSNANLSKSTSKSDKFGAKSLKTVVGSRKVPLRDIPVEIYSKNPHSSLIDSDLKSDQDSKLSSGSVLKSTSKISKSGKFDAKSLKTVNNVKKSAKTFPFKDIPVKIYSKSPDSSSVSVSIDSDRPRTATLRKGSIVNANIVGPDAPGRSKLSVKKSGNQSKPVEDDSNDYEDDFESYESDFEAYSSSTTTTTKSSISQNSCSSSSCSSPQEERKLDSGNFDLTDLEMNKHKQILDNINESTELENKNEKNANPASLSDEGFEEAKSLQYINFLGAKRKTERKKSVEIRKKRGEEILSMIRLDAFSFTIFDSPAIDYDEFIRIYGKGNCVQTGIQTGEDDVDEEIQTEEISMENKWTQCPQIFSSFDISDEKFWIKYKEEFLGVGTNNESNLKNFIIKNNNFPELELKKYISLAGKLILNILEESSLELTKSKFEMNQSIPFSAGFYKIHSELLKNSKLITISFHPTKNHFLTAHENESQFFIAFWEIYNLDSPKKTFQSHSRLSCLDFCDDFFIIAGLENGTISIWNLDTNENELVTASFTSKIASGHFSKIIGIASLVQNENLNLDFNLSIKKNLNKTKEIVTLDMDGILITWIIHLKNTQTNLLLLKNVKTDLKTVYPDLIDLECTDFILDNNNEFLNFLYISTNYGYIMHYLVNNNSKSDLKSFKNDSNLLSSCTCLEKCPFSSKYFLSGYSNGKINLYNNSNEKPLIMLDNHQEQFFSSLKLIQWSRNCPFIIYSLDQENTIHIWNLNESDIFPICSVPFQERVISFKISPMQLDNDFKSSYMVIGTESGIYLHLLNKEHGKQSSEQFAEQKKTFFNYVNRL